MKQGFVKTKSTQQDKRSTLPNVLLCPARLYKASDTCCIAGFFLCAVIVYGHCYFSLVKHKFYSIIIDFKVKLFGIADAEQHVFQVFFAELTRVSPGLCWLILYFKMYSVPPG